ncbi:MAG: hypothetical protein KA055_00905 [Aliarcobacter sp.]|nr:hypothetical protein [Aliarcobacter sp.]
MIHKKILTIVLFSALINVTLFAKQQDADMISYKDYKEKKVTTSVQKKAVPKKIDTKVKQPVNNLPGNLQVGQIAKESFLNKGSMINTNKYENIKNTDIYRVDNRVFRISRNTKEILAILK